MIHHVYSTPFSPDEEFLTALERLQNEHFNMGVITFGEFTESIKELLAQGFHSDYPLGNAARLDFLAALDFIHESSFYLNSKLGDLIFAIQKDHSVANEPTEEDEWDGEEDDDDPRITFFGWLNKIEFKAKSLVEELSVNPDSKEEAEKYLTDLIKAADGLRALKQAQML